MQLFWISHIADWIPVNPENLDALIQELGVFRRAIAESDLEAKASVIEDAERLAEGLLKLKRSSGWEASMARA